MVLRDMVGRQVFTAIALIGNGEVAYASAESAAHALAELYTRGEWVLGVRDGWVMSIIH